MKDPFILLVDMQSFYASIEKADHPELRDRPVVVAGDPERRSGIILAACPLAKKWGVQTAEALWEAQQKCPELVVVQPRMQTYIDRSIQITAILETFSDQVEPYSIDEQFVNMTHTVHLFQNDIYRAVQEIQRDILEKTGVCARVGIGPNKILAKMSCDNFSKKNKDGIFYLHHGNMRTYLWPLPVGNMFGVGSKMKHHLERMGIRTIGHLACFPVHKLHKRWGINGEVLHLTANGIDTSPVTSQTHDRQKAVGHHMTLPHDYEHGEHIQVILLELSEEVARRARSKKYSGDTVSVGVRGHSFEVPTGFYRQAKLPAPTNDGLHIYRVANHLFQQHWDMQPVRSVGVTLSGLSDTTYRQLDLFHSFEREERLSEALDQIREKYGATAIVRAVSKSKAGQAFVRARKIGGHDK